MTQKEADPEWIVACASVAGRGHILHELPCQDSFSYQKINENWSVAVVCDGAGSAKYSHIGSDFVARNTAHCLTEIIVRKNWNPENIPNEEEWRDEAIKALQIVVQRLISFAREQKYEIQDLSSTVLASLFSPFAILTIHIGDGRATFSSKVDDWQPLIMPFRGNEANETVFINSGIWTAEGVEKYIRTNIKKGQIRALALCSDGCEKGSFEVNVFDENLQKFVDLNRPYVKFFEPNVQSLRKLKSENKSTEEINQLWYNFLYEGTKAFKNETDDKTMILAVLNT